MIVGPVVEVVEVPAGGVDAPQTRLGHGSHLVQIGLPHLNNCIRLHLMDQEGWSRGRSRGQSRGRSGGQSRGGAGRRAGGQAGSGAGEDQGAEQGRSRGGKGKVSAV